jgi:hypothetical protein
LIHKAHAADVCTPPRTPLSHLEFPGKFFAQFPHLRHTSQTLEILAHFAETSYRRRDGSLKLSKSYDGRNSLVLLNF